MGVLLVSQSMETFLPLCLLSFLILLLFFHSLFSLSAFSSSSCFQFSFFFPLVLKDLLLLYQTSTTSLLQHRIPLSKNYLCPVRMLNNEKTKSENIWILEDKGSRQRKRTFCQDGYLTFSSNHLRKLGTIFFIDES